MLGFLEEVLGVSGAADLLRTAASVDPWLSLQQLLGLHAEGSMLDGGAFGQLFGGWLTVLESYQWTWRPLCAKNAADVRVTCLVQ